MSVVTIRLFVDGQEAAQQKHFDIGRLGSPEHPDGHGDEAAENDRPATLPVGHVAQQH